MVQAVLTGQLTVWGFDLGWFSSVCSERLCILGHHDAIYIFKKKNLLTSFSLPFSEMSLVGLTVDIS